MLNVAALELDRDGAAIVPGVLSSNECGAVTQALQTLPRSGAGSRSLLTQPGCIALARRLHDALAAHLPRDHVAVQCTYFEKSTALNWLVTLHQDLSIPVSTRTDAPGWSGWSEKEGQLFAQPPVGVLEQSIAVRLHLDVCGSDDGPLRVVPGSHRFGRLGDDEAIRLRADAGEVVCTAEPGDALLLRPLLLHASSKATGRSPRRVLHFVFGPPTLPDGLAWAHVA
jgi:ectoine hydroxylase-related dioxygenase (phytanoyl-CoA dioxygenase family)